MEGQRSPARCRSVPRRWTTFAALHPRPPGVGRRAAGQGGQPLPPPRTHVGRREPAAVDPDRGPRADRDRRAAPPGRGQPVEGSEPAGNRLHHALPQAERPRHRRRRVALQLGITPGAAQRSSNQSPDEATPRTATRPAPPRRDREGWRAPPGPPACARPPATRHAGGHRTGLLPPPAPPGSRPRHSPGPGPSGCRAPAAPRPARSAEPGRAARVTRVRPGRPRSPRPGCRPRGAGRPHRS